MDNRIVQQVNFLIEIDKLKNVIRRNYLADDSRRENVAEHSWHVIMTALVLHEYHDEKNTDLLKVIKLLAIHDLVEIYAGDVFLFDTRKDDDKYERELNAAEKLFALLPPDQQEEMKSLWLEFEHQETPESHLALCLDRIIPVLLNTHNEGTSWKEGKITRQVLFSYMEPVKRSSVSLWALLQQLAQQAIMKGSLIEE